MSEFLSGILFGLGLFVGLLIGGILVAWILWRFIRHNLVDIEKHYNELIDTEEGKAESACGILGNVRGEPGLTDEESRDNGIGPDGVDR